MASRHWSAGFCDPKAKFGRAGTAGGFGVSICDWLCDCGGIGGGGAGCVGVCSGAFASAGGGGGSGLDFRKSSSVFLLICGGLTRGLGSILGRILGASRYVNSSLLMIAVFSHHG